MENKLKKISALVVMFHGGYPENIKKIYDIKKKYNFFIIEDACHALGAQYRYQNKLLKVGSCKHADISTFSLHPLKNINVWSDGGVITTNNKIYYEKLKLLRNHGLISRDKVKLLGYNSRLDTFQAIVGSWLLPKAKMIANKRIKKRL